MRWIALLDPVTMQALTFVHDVAEQEVADDGHVSDERQVRGPLVHHAECLRKKAVGN